MLAYHRQSSCAITSSSLPPCWPCLRVCCSAPTNPNPNPNINPNPNPNVKPWQALLKVGGAAWWHRLHAALGPSLMAMAKHPTANFVVQVSELASQSVSHSVSQSASKLHG